METCIPKLIRVTTIDILKETAKDFSLMYEIPMLIAKDAAIMIIAANHTINFLKNLSEEGNPILFHLISSGSGALEILTLLIGN